MSRAFGKVILFGEHAVVYGRPAIAAALDRGASATAAPSNAARLTLEPWGISIAPSREDRGEHADLARAFADLLDACDVRIPLDVRVHASIAAGEGLGCSAAIAVAIVRAIDETLRRERSLDAVVDASLAWERVFHGAPSGIDSVLAARGGIVRFARDRASVPLVPRVPMTFCVASSGQVASTKAMVDCVARQRTRSAGRVEQTFAAIESIVNNAQLAIERGELRAVGQLLDMNHSLLAGLMLSTSRLEDLIKIARESGALGAKLTGSGGGGAIIALAPTEPEPRQKLLAALRRESKDAFELTVAA